MRPLRIALLAVATVIATSPALHADTFTFTMNSPGQLVADLTVTATPFSTGIDIVTGVSGTFWEAAMGGTYLTNSQTGGFTLIPAAIGSDPITTAAISPVPGSACANGQPDSPACFTNGAFYYDDLIYKTNTPGPGSVDWGGFLFGNPATGLELNIFSYDGSQWYWADNQGGHVNNLINGAQTGNGLSPVPEPGTLMLLGAGLLGLAMLVFRGANRTRGVKLAS